MENYNYDSFVGKQLLSSVGCRPFYLDRIRKYPPCDSKEKNARAYKVILNLIADPKDVKNVKKPCSEFTKISTISKEITNADREYFWIKKSEKIPEKFDGWFDVVVSFRKKTYTEISQIRAYSLQSLVGNAGGYVGLFVGYSIAELPLLFEIVYKYMADRFWPAQN